MTLPSMAIAGGPLTASRSVGPGMNSIQGAAEPLESSSVPPWPIDAGPRHYTLCQAIRTPPFSESEPLDHCPASGSIDLLWAFPMKVSQIQDSGF